MFAVSYFQDPTRLDSPEAMKLPHRAFAESAVGLYLVCLGFRNLGTSVRSGA